MSAAGIRSQIYVEVPDPQTASETRDYRDYATEAAPGDVLVYQLATSSAISNWLAGRSEPVVLNYHGITPPDAFRPWNNSITRLQVGAQQELALLAPRAALGVAPSRFDAGELARAGCSSIEVVPVANVAVPPPEPDSAAAERLAGRRGGGAWWLSVGRLAPNKSHERTIAALLAARTGSDPEARLTIVGAPTEPHYAAALHRFAAELGLADAVDFTTGLSDGELAAHYRSADVLVMLSDHEGFGVPLIEAMGQGLPIVAYRAGAVPETVADAAVVVDDRRPGRVAEVVSRLLADAAGRQRLVAAGRRRVQELDLAGAADRFVELVTGLREQVRATA